MTGSDYLQQQSDPDTTDEKVTGNGCEVVC